MARAVVALVVGGAACWAGGASVPRPATELPLAIVVDGQALAGDEIFGPGPEATNPSSERVGFDLPLILADDGPHRILLRYAVARAPSERIEIRLNGTAVAYAAASLDGWSDGVELPLPAEGLRSGGPLRIDFVDALHDTSKESPAWNLGAPELVVQPTPACDPAECLEQAERLHALGRREYEGKSLGPRNLFDAWTHLDRAVDFLEALGGEGAALGRTRSLRDQARGELDDRCAALRFTVMRGVALDDRHRSREAAEKILRVFPDSAHPCHDSGRRMLALLD